MKIYVISNLLKYKSYSKHNHIQITKIRNYHNLHIVHQVINYNNNKILSIPINYNIANK